MFKRFRRKKKPVEVEDIIDSKQLELAKRRRLKWLDQEFADEGKINREKIKTLNKCASMQKGERGKHKNHGSSDNFLECQAEAVGGIHRGLGRQKSIKEEEEILRFGSKKEQAKALGLISEEKEEGEGEDVELDVDMED